MIVPYQPPTLTHPAILEARQLLALEDQHWQRVERARTRMIDNAIRLSGGDLTVFQALLRGETVPVGRLDLEWVRKLGVR